MDIDEELERLLMIAADEADTSNDTTRRFLERMAESQDEILDEHADEVTFAGGDGHDLDSAVVVLGAVNSAVGVNAEYQVLERRFGKRNQDWTLLMQSLIEGPHGRQYDVITIQRRDGTREEIYFDISDFFGK